ncbi:MAG: 2-amino-4-hydroxy-6-hydroxymethyldihydropteridine diphosphokinase [Halioglobus sp.]|nr:2-amino-4-hydroxy-6-hydroxymethyldihydropteridine diphosphokinase [Halioglobus sp.]
MTPAYVGLGSNLQQPLLQLQRALIAIAQLPSSQLLRVSSVYRSAAVGPGEQPDYLNAALQLDTRLQPAELLAALQAIEQAQGRVRTIRWGARTLDLDILLYGDRQIATSSLTIPHPELQRRNFVLYPLAEIAGPHLVLPDGTELDTLIARCPRGDLVRTRLRLTPQTSVPPDME